MEVGRDDQLDCEFGGANRAIGGDVGTQDFQAEQTRAEFGERSEIVFGRVIGVGSVVSPDFRFKYLGATL